MRILVSGFEPFLDEKVNPTQSIVNFVNSCDSHARGWDALDVRGVLLPVLFDVAFQRLEEERNHFRPDVILSFGLAGGRESVDLEYVALNFRGGEQSARGDNSGRKLEGPIESHGPFALPSTLPIEEMLLSLNSAGIPARRSLSAGSYVCNDLFFQTQNRLSSTSVQSGFIHVPRLAPPDSVASATAWPWSKFETAVDAILKTFLKSRAPK
jgi:pyroglutamyl-peptidase